MVTAGLAAARVILRACYILLHNKISGEFHESIALSGPILMVPTGSTSTRMNELSGIVAEFGPVEFSSVITRR